MPIDLGHVERVLETMRAEFAKFGNPLVLWGAYRLARNLRRGPDGQALPVPTWILEAFDAVADRCADANNGAAVNGDWTKTIVRMFGFTTTTGGPTDPFLASTRQECERLADAIARGGPLETLLQRLTARQTRCTALEQQLAVRLAQTPTYVAGGP